MISMEWNTCPTSPASLPASNRRLASQSLHLSFALLVTFLAWINPLYLPVAQGIGVTSGTQTDLISTRSTNVATELIALPANPLLSIDRSYAPSVSVVDANAYNTGSGRTHVRTAVALPDGKILVGGHFHLVNGIARRGLARFNTDGSLDSTFDPGFGVRHSADVESLLVQADGKIVVGGNFSRINLKLRPLIARFLTNGTQDTAFSPPLSGEYIRALAAQKDGKLIAGGSFSYTNNAVAQDSLVRLMPDGSIDRSFSLPEGFSFFVNALAVQPSDDKILVAGDIYGPKDQEYYSLIRLNTDGSVDLSFKNQTTDFESISSVVLQSDGQILIGGDFSTLNGRPVSYLARLSSRGDFDTTFKAEITDVITSLALDSQGRILAGGQFDLVSRQTRHRAVRLQTDGSLDRSFDVGDGPKPEPDSPNGQTAIHALLPLPNGKIFVAGDFTFFGGTNHQYCARIDEAGVSDPTWKRTQFASASILYTMTQQSDGKLLIGGEFSHVNGVRRPGIARLLSDGTLDSSFTSPFESWTNAPNIFRPLVSAIGIQPDGTIVVGGRFLNRETGSYGAAKLRPNGTIDPSFTTTFAEESYVSTLARQSDGGWIAGGSIVVDKITYGVLRMNSDGSVDRGYRRVILEDSQFDPPILTMVQRTDGKVYIGGTFQRIDGVPRRNIARLNSDGSVDGAFDTAQGVTGEEGIFGDNAQVSSLRVQSDGKVVIGGYFSKVRGIAQTNIARLNLDGSMDTSFRPRVNSDVIALDITPGGRIALAGIFTTVNDEVRNGLAWINPDGSTAEGLTGGSNDDLLVTYSLLFGSSESLFVGGDYSVVAGQTRLSLSRFITQTPAIAPRLSLSVSPSGARLTASGTAGSSVIIESSENLISWKHVITIPLTDTETPVPSEPITAATPSSRFYRARLAP